MRLEPTDFPEEPNLNVGSLNSMMPHNASQPRRAANLGWPPKGSAQCVLR